MHCVFEGMVPFHFRDTLKLTTAEAKKKDKSYPAFSHYFRIPVAVDHPDYPTLPVDQKLTQVQINQVRLIHTSLTASLAIDVDGDDDGDDDDGDGEHYDLEALKEELGKRQMVSLKFVCSDLGLKPLVERPHQRPYKIHYAKALVEWVRLLF